MLGISGLLGSSGDGAASAAPIGPPEGGGGAGGSNSGGFSEDDKAMRSEEGDRSSAGNRWPRQETLALLKIRSDMDVVFRDSSIKGPLWEEVSRKLAELGFQRSAKKCKEKFENVYKYHKRTKEGRASKPDAKTYRFFDQLEALDNHPIPSLPPPPLQQQQQPKLLPPPAATAPPMLPAAAAPLSATISPPPPPPQITVPSATANNPTTNSASQNTSASTPTVSASPTSMNPSPPPQHQPLLQQPRNPTNIPQSLQTYLPANPSQGHSFRNLPSNSTSSSSSTSSDETLDGSGGGGGRGGRKRKRKWKDFFERLMRDVIKKQEELQKRFLEAIEKRERDRMVREDAWRVQEMARMNREHEILVQERSIAAAKDAALISFLQKMSSDPQNPVQVPPIPEGAAAAAAVLQTQPPLPQAQPQTPTQAQPQHQTQLSTALAFPQPQPAVNFGSIVKISDSMSPMGMEVSVNVASSAPSTSSSRWPKTEVLALIKLRTDLDVKYQESGPKGPLWEEISTGMRQLGYSRNAKRCKEKWENINKYFKKVKESNKKRPEDSKTCPYFHQLDALYRKKSSSTAEGSGGVGGLNLNPSYGGSLKSAAPSGQAIDIMVPLMVRPEQQWPLHPEDQRQLPPPPQQNHPEDIGSENMEEPNPDDEMDDVDDGDDDDDDEDDEGGGYEIVTNKPAAPAAGES